MNQEKLQQNIRESASPVAVGEDPSIRPKRLPNRGARIVVVCAVALVLVPLAVMELPREVARWYAASAEEMQLDGKTDAAVKQLDRAIDWDAENPSYWASRSREYMELKQFDAALDDVNRALELAPDERSLLSQRSLVLQRMGRHAEAIADWTRIIEKAERELKQSDGNVEQFTGTGPTAKRAYAEALNGRAYARALAGIEIEQALADVDRAMRLWDAGDNAMFLDTRGYLHLLAGNVEQAAIDMDKAVELAEAEFGTELAALKNADAKHADPRLVRLWRRQVREMMAVIYHHRGLVRQKLGNDGLAEQDIERARQWGYNPAEGVW